MEIDQIKEKLYDKLIYDEGWVDALNDTSPNHYGVEEWEVEFDPNEMAVEPKNKSYKINNANFNFQLRLGESGNDALIQDFSKGASAEGTWDFDDARDDVKIEDLKIDVDLDLYGKD